MTHPETVIKNPSWWRRRSQMERGLVLMAGLTTALCIILIALLTYTAYKDENRGITKTEQESNEKIVKELCESTLGLENIKIDRTYNIGNESDNLILTEFATNQDAEKSPEECEKIEGVTYNSSARPDERDKNVAVKWNKINFMSLAASL